MTLETCDPNNSSLRLQGAKVHLMLSNGQEREKDARTGEERGRALSSLWRQGERSATFFCHISPFLHISLLYSWDKLNHQGQGNHPLYVF